MRLHLAYKARRVYRVTRRLFSRVSRKRRDGLVSRAAHGHSAGDVRVGFVFDVFVCFLGVQGSRDPTERHICQMWTYLKIFADLYTFHRYGAAA